MRDLNNGRGERIAVVLPQPLVSLIDAKASASFESRETVIVALLDSALQRSATSRRRDGGKPPAATLLRRLKPRSKRARMLRYFLHTPGASVSGAMAEFKVSRSAVFATFTALNLIHGVGYAFDSHADAILVRLPCREADVFA